MKVLIVDDERPIRQYIALLVKTCSYEVEDVLEERNPTQVVARIIDERPDVVFLDISMPQMDGLTVLKKIKQIDDAPQVIILTCHEEFEYARTALQLNAMDYVLKDEVNAGIMEQLLARVGALTDGSTETEKSAPGRMDLSSSQLISNAVKYISRNYMFDLSCGSVSKEFYVNPDYFCRKFKQVTGVNFSEYIKQVRLEESKRLLLNSNASVTEIASRVGFRNSSYFSYSFKKEFGCSPVDYRKNTRSNS